jgi:predicted nucleic acid-binding Zn ribbon protein
MKRLTHAVPGALMELLRGAPLSDGKVTFAWNAAVGPALERVTTVKLERTVLIVDAASAQWSRELERLRGVILARLQSLLGKDVVSSIVIRAEG